MNNSRWADLAPRLGSAVVMVAVGFGAIWVGGVVFNVFVALICGAMVWELSRMLAPDAGGAAIQMGVMTGAILLLCAWLPPFYVLPFLFAPAVAGAARIVDGKGLYLGFAMLIALAGYSLISVRENLGIDWILWLICVVIATDVAGYFAGKSIGGAGLPIVAMVYPIRVKSLAAKYPEEGQRVRKWFSSKKAASLVAQPELARIIKDFEPSQLQ